jgi:hypothetical protein
MEKNNLTHLSTKEPTYWSTDKNKVPDLVDFCITKGISKELQTAQSCFELSSDHSPILVTISAEVIKTHYTTNLGTKYINWNTFHDLLDAKLITQIPLKPKYDIDQAIEHLNKSIKDAIKQSTPAKRTVSKQQDLPDIIKQHIADKRRLRKLWQIT